jgi:hypothetical protein
VPLPKLKANSRASPQNAMTCRKPPRKNKSTSHSKSLTDWERIDHMRDKDTILDDEHPEADSAHMLNIKVWKNRKLVREIK